MQRLRAMVLQNIVIGNYMDCVFTTFENDIAQNDLPNWKVENGVIAIWVSINKELQRDIWKAQTLIREKRESDYYRNKNINSD